MILIRRTRIDTYTRAFTFVVLFLVVNSLVHFIGDKFFIGNSHLSY